jgi:hypothetical protein
VEKTLGRPGAVQGEEFQVLFPRTDLNVVVQGYPLDSANALASRFTFQALPEDSQKKAQMEGRIYLLASEVPQAMAQAAKGGLEVTALYSPFLDDSPDLKCLRLKGQGTLSGLAWAAKRVLSDTGTPMDPPKTVPPTASPTALATPLPDPHVWSEVQDLLGPGEEKGQTLLYKWDGKDRNIELVFQNHGKETTAFGECGVREGDSKALVEEFLQRHVAVTAVFNYDFDGNRLSLVDFWAVGNGKKLAEDLKEMLAPEETNP